LLVTLLLLCREELETGIVVVELETMAVMGVVVEELEVNFDTGFKPSLIEH